MSSFNQGVPTVPTLINSSNCIVLGNTSSGTALTVQQLGAGAVMNVATSTGSSALFVSSTGQVGIGVTNPGSLLSFGAPGLINKILTLTDQGATDTPATATNFYGFGINSGLLRYNVPTGGVHAFYEGSTERMRILNGGNVGIGTTSPGYILEVSNSTASTSTSFLGLTNPYVFGFNTGLNIGSSIVYSSRWQGDGGSGVVEMCKIDGRKEQNANYGDSYLAFQTRYETNRGLGGAGTLTEKMRITGIGNVGIGTASLGGGQGKLFVANDVTLTSGNYAGDVAAQIMAVGTTNPLKRLALMYDTTNNIGLVQAMIAGSGTSPLCLNAAGGNVGIGTTSPGAQLTLTSNLYAGGMIQSAGAAGGITNQGAYMAWNLSTARGETDFINQQGLGSGGWNWYNYNNSNQLTSNAAYLSSTGGLTLGTYSNAYTAPSGGLICPGNVGIGTTNPGYLLDVNGTIATRTDIRFSGTGLNAADKKLYSPADGDLEWMTNTAAGVRGFAVSHQGTKIVYLNTSGNSYLNGGNVGIGLTGPSYQLDLSTDGARKLTSTTWLTGSDQRIKTDIESANLQMCYDTVKSIDLKYFKWNFPTESNVVPDDKHSLGFIAQEVKTVFPNAVSESNSYGYSDFLSLNTDQILKAMYGALKQTMADKEALEQSLSSLEQRLAAAGL